MFLKPHLWQHSHVTKLAAIPQGYSENLVAELRRLITDARRRAALLVNSALTKLYWR